MQSTLEDFLLEYEYYPSPDSEERLAQAWELILALILEEFENEQTAEPESAE